MKEFQFVDSLHVRDCIVLTVLLQRSDICFTKVDCIQNILQCILKEYVGADACLQSKKN